MNNRNDKVANGPPEMALSLEDIIRRGARDVIQQAIEAELAELLGGFANVTTFNGQRAVVRNGHLPKC